MSDEAVRPDSDTRTTRDQDSGELERDSGGARIVDEWLEAKLGHERDLLTKLHDLLIRANVDEEKIRTTKGLIDNLEELFLLVVVGEVKAGKSSFINSIVGQKVCKEGAIPVTDRVHILRYGEKEKERVLGDYLVERFLPCDKLRTLHIVDTPGTNSIVAQHQEITEDFIPRCDMVLFTTSADRPFSETEHQFLNLIAEGWSRKIVFVLTKVDIKEADEISEVVQYVRDSAKKFYDKDFLVFPVSSKQAFEAKIKDDTELYEKSGFKALEDYLFEQLNTGEKLAIKLHSPVNAAIRICDQTREDFSGRLDLLKSDTEIVDTIEAQLAQSEKELKENYGRFLLEADNVLFEFEKRARDWIDENLRLTRPGILRNAERFQHAFQSEVVKDFDLRLEEVFHRAVDWFTKRNLKIWQDTLEFFNSRIERGASEGKVVGKVGAQFEYNRDQVFESVKSSAQDKVRNFDRDAQVKRMIRSAGNALSLTLGISLTAVGGATLAVALSTGFAAIDVTGITLGVLLTGASLFVLPAKRSRIKADFSNKVAELRRALNEVMRQQIEGEATEAMGRIREVMKPYMDYCQRETGAIRERLESTDTLRTQFVQLKGELAGKYGDA